MIEQGELTQNYNADSLRLKALPVRFRRDVSYTTVCDTVRRDSIHCYPIEKAFKKTELNLPPGGETECDTLHLVNVYCHTDSTVTMTPLDTLYGARSFPTIADSMIKTVINQYDLYGSAGWNINPEGDSVYTDANPVNFPKTRLTRTKILDANTNNWSEECFTYDKYGRVTTRRVYIPELAQTKKFQYYYDASGRVLKTMYQDGQSDSFYQWFTYDNLSRLDSVFSSRTNSRATAVREAVYDYDNNHGGKVLQTKVGNNIQQVDYTYNTRDWLKYINNVNSLGTDKFALSLGYDTVGTNPRFNGNISSSASLVSGQSQYAYNYVYDKANRLTDANYSGNLFSEKSIGYDANGNITALTRYLNSASATPINYVYDVAKPNQLRYVTGALADSFYYDANGNMTRDKLKGNFDYDYRNMPVRMYLNSGKIIHIAYDAGGQRIKYLRKSGSTTLDSSKIFILGANGKVVAEYIYLSSVWQVDHYNIYGNELIGKVTLIPATSGTVNKTGQINSSQTADSLFLSSSQIQSGGSVTLLAKNGIRVQSTFNSNGATVNLKPGVATAGSGATAGFTEVRYYYLHDHLGSVRVTLKEDGTVDSWRDHYAFGKVSRSSQTTNSPAENFTGHQLDGESSLLYAGARYYNSDIARWISVDPDDEKYPSFTPYNYAEDDPIGKFDPTGRGPGFFVKTVKKIWKEVTRGNALEETAKKGDVLVKGKGSSSAAKKLRKDAGVDKKTTRHDGHNLPNGEKGMPHYQNKSGGTGHTYYAPAAAGATAGESETTNSSTETNNSAETNSSSSGGSENSDSWLDIIVGALTGPLEDLVNPEQLGKGIGNTGEDVDGDGVDDSEDEIDNRSSDQDETNQQKENDDTDSNK